MDLIKVIDDHLLRESALTGYRNRGNHYPSQASVKYLHTGYGEEVIKGACMRAMYYRCKGYEPEPFDARTYYTFACGNIFEDWFTEQCKQARIWVSNSIKFFNDDIKLSGEIDVLIKDPETDELVIVELKTTSGYYSWREIAGNKSIKGKPKPAHLLQLMLYLYEHRAQVKKGILFYFNLDNKQKKQFVIELEEDGGRHYFKIDGTLFKTFAVEDIHDRYREAQGYIDREELPRCDYSKCYSPEQVEILNARGEIAKTNYIKYKQNPEKNPLCDWVCSYCSYKEHCEKDSCA